MRLTNRHFIAIAGMLAIISTSSVSAIARNHDEKQSFDFSEGTVSKAVITAGPFDLHRKYRSMEGPYISYDFKVGDIIESKEISLPEGLVVFVENGGAAPSMAGGGSAQTNSTEVKGLVHSDLSHRTLLWLKGVKLEVLDENDKVLPTAEFICHWNLDVKPNFRNEVFKEGEKCASVRLATVTQGQTEITFPQGFAVPVSSDETWNAVFQAANRTTNDHRRVKHRCTFYFIKDQDLVYPVTALAWQVPWIHVIIDKNNVKAAEEVKSNCPSCLGISVGVNAPNNTSNGVFTDSKGQRVSGHWVIPPGTHTYTGVIDEEFEPGFAAKPRIVHTIWSHVHPLCSNLSLYECAGDTRKKLTSVGVKTDTKHGLEIKHIENWSSEKGIILPAKENYELEITYKNTTGVPQDSMAATGIFFEDPTFARPEWVLKGKDSYACSVRPVGDATASAAAAVPAPATSTVILTPQEIIDLPAFDLSKDGPLLTMPKTVQIETNVGPLNLYIDPSLAPATATQVYRLLKAGAFNGTRLSSYSSNFMLQIAAAEDKAKNQSSISEKAKILLRRIPLEASAQKPDELSHHKYTLGMAHYDDRQDSGVSSFFILVQDAPQLDHGYAIFGKLGEDPATLGTLAKIGKNWNSDRYWIVDTKEL
jgi:cyclophilin family peptidyl-prolyl cis-trans isomerase